MKRMSLHSALYFASKRYIFRHACKHRRSLLCIALSLALIYLIRVYYDIRKAKILDFECQKKFITFEKNGNKSQSYLSTAEAPSYERAPPTIPRSFLIERKDFCQKRPGLRLITYVHSAISRPANRQAVRETWGSFDPVHVGVVFMVGVAKTPWEEAIVREESALYGDIVQGNYTDLYERLTYKALNALHWVAKNCARVPWLMHADDDIIVDVRLLLSMTDLLEAEQRTNEIFCYVWWNSLPFREEGKWKLTEEQYPCKFYPHYCDGPGWIASTRIINTLLSAVPKTKYFWIDDVYLTGFLAQKSGVELAPMAISREEFDPSDIGNVVLWMDADQNRTRKWRQVERHYNQSQALLR